MIGEETEKMLGEAMKAEIRHGIEKYGEFHTHHEAIAVLLEELQEAKEITSCLPDIGDDVMKTLWESVKGDEVTKGKINLLEDILMNAFLGAGECIQVAAMCSKWILKIEADKEVPEDDGAS